MDWNIHKLLIPLGLLTRIFQYSNIPYKYSIRKILELHGM